MNNYNIIINNNQEFLNDISSTGKKNDWQSKKIDNLQLANAYKRVGFFEKSLLMRDCATFLEFRQYHDNILKLNKANFCKIRLCSVCSWRRSLKIFSQVSQIMNELCKDNEKSYIFATFTVKNCLGSELAKTIDDMMKSYDRLMKKTIVKKNILGSFRTLEITHNTNKFSENFNTYHPHFHCIFCVNKSYFNSRKDNYIKTSDWVDLWQNCLNIDYKPICDIRTIDKNSNNIKHAVSEVAKYSVKSSDILCTKLKYKIDKKEREKLIDEAVFYIHTAIRSRRLFAFAGIFKDIHKQLNLSENIDDDLIHTDNQDEIREDLDYIIVRYCWNVGYNNYTKIND